LYQGSSAIPPIVHHEDTKDTKHTKWDVSIGSESCETQASCNAQAPSDVPWLRVRPAREAGGDQKDVRTHKRRTQSDPVCVSVRLCDRWRPAAPATGRISSRVFAAFRGAETFVLFFREELSHRVATVPWQRGNRH
jgi:hypothetical protein